jgi:hypothetical protein
LNQNRTDAESDRVFRNVISAMTEFRRVFHRDAEPCALAEIYAARRLGLSLNIPETQQGFDATDRTGKRYQIKYRKAQNVDINNFDFDYIVLVNFDENYQLTGIWRATVEQAKTISGWREGKGYARYQVTQTKFKGIAEKVI